MAIEIVRTPSDTPNIVNTDDFIGLRYAYGNQRGYVKSKGAEIGYSASQGTFTITSGRMVVDGVEVDIDADGSSVTIDNIAIKRYFTVYLEVNLSTTTATIKSQYQNGTYPTISGGDDLTANTIGTANLVLYTFDATSGVASNIVKKIQPIAYLSDFASGNGKVKAAITADNYNATSGTIKNKFTSIESDIADLDTRLTNLGFSQSTVTLSSGSATTNSVKRQGNYVIGNVKVTGSTGGLNATKFTIPTDYRPSVVIVSDIGVVSVGQGQPFNDMVTMTINTDGTVVFSGTIRGYYISSYNVNFGYEAPARS